VSANRIIPGLFFLLVGLIYLGVAHPLLPLIAGICALIIGILYLVKGV
jgi:hypothetical protein